MTIGKKLFAGCGALLAITLLVGGIAIRNVGNLGSDVMMLGDHYIHILYVAGDLHSHTEELVSISRGVLLRGHLHDPSRVAQLREKYEEQAGIIKQEASEIGSSTKYPEVRERAQDEIPNELEALNQAAANVAEAILRGDLATADAINNEKIVPLGAKLSSAGDQVAKLEEKYAQQFGSESVAMVPMARTLSLAMILLSLGVGAVVVFIVRKITGDLSAHIAELRDGAEQVNSAASQVSASSQSLAQGASEQAASLEETSASSEEINSMARRNTDNSRSTAELLAQSQGKVNLANQHLAEMVTSMNEINDSSAKISKIIRVIDEIAFQTNILALNAAVEAARAGEAGMGFAVVADEVRSLAQRSAQAAKDTALLIEESIAKSNDGKSKVDQVAATIRAVTEDTVRIKVMVDEVSLGSEEQSRGIDQIGRAIVQMEQITQTTAANAEESAAAAEELNAQSQAMSEIVGRLFAMVDGDASVSARLNRSSTVPRMSRPALTPRSSSPLPRRSMLRTAPARSRAANGKGMDPLPMEESFQSF
jgi:methyl-accepting chemotaxis protein/methyl-accepting chemotaxis protein-1 (serine sensor receptor)